MCICKVGCEEDEYWRNCEDPGEMIAKFRWVNPLGDKKFAEHQTEFRTRRATDTDWPAPRAAHPRVDGLRFLGRIGRGIARHEWPRITPTGHSGWRRALGTRLAASDA